jgi:hypothetical protein
MLAVLHRERRTLLFIAAGVFSSFIAASATAVCNLPPQVQQRMQFFGSGLAEGLTLYNRGLSYYEFRCYAEASAELNRAVTVLTPIARPGTRQNEWLGLSRAALVLSQAHAGLASDRPAAIAQIVSVAERTAPSLIKVMAIMALVKLLDANAPEWTRIDQQLDTLAEQGYWQATKVIAHRKLARGEPAAAYVERRLARADRTDAAHGLRIVLADIWRASGRTLEAWLLIRMSEEAAGEEILDGELRIEFLRVAKAVAQARGRAGDADAARSVAIYDAALREAEGPIR